MDAWSWVPAEIVSTPGGVAAFLSDSGEGVVSSSAEALFPVVNLSEETSSQNTSPNKEESLSWVAKGLDDDTQLIQSGSNSSILGRISDGDVHHPEMPEGGGEEAYVRGGVWKSPGLLADGGIEDDRVNASSSPLSSRSIGSGRGCRRRVHPVSKFIGEEVCWTPDDNDGSDSNGSKERLRRAPRTGKSSGRLNRARGRAFGRQGGWDGLGSSTSDSINKRRKQHNPWSLEETRMLVRGVEICGGGKWADIKRLGFREIANRSPVDLKDKWRNLLRVALLPVEQIRLKKADNRHNLPLELLQHVKELAQGGDKQPRSLHKLSSRRSVQITE